MSAACGYTAATFVELTLEMHRSMCGVTEDVRLYMTGLRCLEHTPSALAGRPEVTVDPDLTLAALKRRAGRLEDFVPPPNDSSLLDQRAINSGKRRSRPQTYRDAQRAEYERRMQREGLK